MNYKRRKPKVKVRCTYCTDNRVGNSGRLKNIEDEWRPVPAKHPSWYCKKRKGRHQFLLKKQEKFRVLSGIFQTFICVSCGKKKLKHLDNPKVTTRSLRR